MSAFPNRAVPRAGRPLGAGRWWRVMVTVLALALAVVVPSVSLTGCATKKGAAVMYHCPMHPTYVSDRPADCPICNMAMVPMTPDPGTGAGAGTGMSAGTHDMPGTTTAPMGSDGTPAAGDDHAAVHIAPDVARRSGVVVAEADYGRIARAIHAVGYVVADEARRTSVESRVGGWVRFLHVAATGRTVSAGEPMLVIESPELLAAQQEFVSALNAKDRLAPGTAPEVADNLAALGFAARNRLELFGLPRASIEDLARTRQPLARVPVLAPARGTVVAKSVVEGQRVEPGMTLFALADLSRVWIEARVFETDLASVRVGQAARLTLASDAAFDGTASVAQIVPSVDEATRTLLVRLTAANDDGRLVPGAYADVAFEQTAETGIVIPVSAVLDTGTRKLVFVKRPDDHYEPRAVTLGPSDGEMVLVHDGVLPGDHVVTQAAFLVDSESRLKASIAKAMPAGHAHGSGE
jgi:Cu(I)/Ag(I) efflux system membrane fusion protein